MASYDLDGLVSALLGAVHRAQSAAQDQHVDLANRYFERKDDSLQPKSVKLSLPSLSRPGEMDSIDVPLITLVPISSMMIKEVEFKFQAFINELTDTTQATDASKRSVELPGAAAEGMRVKIGLDGGWNVQRRNVMKVRVKVEATDPPEGVMRVTDRIVKQLP